MPKPATEPPMREVFAAIRDETRRSHRQPRGLHASRTAHRVVSSLYFAGLALAAPYVVSGDGFANLDLALAVAVVAGMILCGIAVSFMVHTRTGHIAMGDDLPLDEREVQLRHRAGLISHRIMLSAALLAVIVLGLPWGFMPEVTLDRDQLSRVALLTFLAVLALPGAVLAWIEPAPVPDTEPGLPEST